MHSSRPRLSLPRTRDCWASGARCVRLIVKCVAFVCLCVLRSFVGEDVGTSIGGAGQVYDGNQSLIGEHTKRAANQAALVGHLKDVNAMIQRAARLRVGSAKAAVVSASRRAIKSGNVRGVVEVVRMGG